MSADNFKLGTPPSAAFIAWPPFRLQGRAIDSPESRPQGEPQHLTTLDGPSSGVAAQESAQSADPIIRLEHSLVIQLRYYNISD